MQNKPFVCSLNSAWVQSSFNLFFKFDYFITKGIFSMRNAKTYVCDRINSLYVYTGIKEIT